jgi:Aspartyl/Asparaginyl beta-hydroxylase.
MPTAAFHSDAIIETALRLPFKFDPARLKDDLAFINTADWQAHFNNSIYQGDWSGVALRAVPGSHLAIYSDPAADTWADTPLLGQCPTFREVLNSFNCPLLSVRLLRLGPGAVIKEHRDPMLGLNYGEVRIHVVVSTNPNVECRLQGRPYHWAAGECWYADFSCAHSFANRGDTERVHMVLDCKVNDWLRTLLEQQGEASLLREQPTTANNLIIPQRIETLSDWVMLKDHVAMMQNTTCRLSHERVKLENGMPIRNNGMEDNFPRIGLCNREIRSQQLGCGHTIARYHLRDIIRALQNSGVLTTEDSATLEQTLDSIANEIQLIDHLKGEEEKNNAILLEQLNGIASQSSDTELLAVVEQIKSMEKQHDAYVDKIGSIRDRVLTYLEAGIACES